VLYFFRRKNVFIRGGFDGMTKKKIMLGQSLRLSQICRSDTDQRGNEPSSSFIESVYVYIQDYCTVAGYVILLKKEWRGQITRQEHANDL
jgi:hypothetical protein